MKIRQKILRIYIELNKMRGCELRPVEQSLNYIIRSRSSASLVSESPELPSVSGNTSNFWSLGLTLDIFSRARRDICHWREIRPGFLLYLPVARYYDIGMAVGARLQAHPSYSAETLPLEEECTMGPGYKNVIVLHAHARFCLRRTREYSLDRGS